MILYSLIKHFKGILAILNLYTFALQRCLPYKCKQYFDNYINQQKKMICAVSSKILNMALVGGIRSIMAIQARQVGMMGTFRGTAGFCQQSNELKKFKREINKKNKQILRNYDQSRELWMISSELQKSVPRNSPMNVQFRPHFRKQIEDNTNQVLIHSRQTLKKTIQSVKSISECLNVAYRPTQEIYNLCWKYDIELWNRISKEDKKKKRMEKKAEKEETARLKLKK